MKKLRVAVFLVLISVLLSLVSENACAAKLRIAVLDVTRIMQEAPQALAMRDKILHQFGPEQENIKLQQEKVGADLKRLHTDTQLTRKEYRKLHRHVVDEQKKLRAMQESFTKSLSVVHEDSFITIKKQIEVVTADYAKEQHFTLVFNKDSVLKNDDANIDITEQILSQLKKEE